MKNYKSFVCCFKILIELSIMDDTITFLSGVIDKLPHRPSSDDESRSLFKRIISSMSKGDVRKHIIKDLERYFGIFEEYLVEKESAQIKQLVGGARKEKKVLEQQDQFVKNIQAKASNTEKSTAGVNLFSRILSGVVTVDGCIRNICGDSFGAINNGIETYKSNKLLVESAFSRVAIELSCNRDMSIASLACVLSYFYVVLPSRRQQICNLLMAQGIDGSSTSRADALRVVALAVNFLGFVGYWVSVSVRGACNDTIGWSIDDGKKGGGANGLLLADLDCQYLVVLLKDVCMPPYEQMFRHADPATG